MDDKELDAGALGAWLDGARAAIRGERDAEVPCGTCTACCTSSQFVHIGPDEPDALAAIPAELTFAAPRAPAGHVLMGYDEHGRCPMLVDDACSIYDRRPRTCRTYDCRVFPATGEDPAADGKPLIAERARRWHFTIADAADEAAREALRAAAAYVRERGDELPPEAVPTTATQRAALTVEISAAFQRSDDEGQAQPQAVRVELSRRRAH